MDLGAVVQNTKKGSTAGPRCSGAQYKKRTYGTTILGERYYETEAMWIYTPAKTKMSDPWLPKKKVRNPMLKSFIHHCNSAKADGTGHFKHLTYIAKP